jgi:TldD protein
MQFADSIFATRFHITRHDLEKYLAEALSHGGDYADLYFEYLLTSSISIDESIVKSAAQGVNMGVGVRATTSRRRRSARLLMWRPTSPRDPARWRSSV